MPNTALATALALATGQCLRPCPPGQCPAWAPAPPPGARLAALGSPALPGEDTGPRDAAPPPRLLESAASQVADLWHDPTTSGLQVVRRSGHMGDVVSIEYKTADITATAGKDYEATEGTLTFQVRRRS